MSKTSGAGRKSKPALLPEEVRQAAWNEAIATIAGGFAHDANNCLTGIFSMSDLCLAQVDAANPLHESLSLMRDSASQASQLLQRLTKLIYDVTGTRTYHDLNEITSETADILRRVLPRSLDLRLELHSEPLPIFVDAVQLRQVLICLALNAADSGIEAATIMIATAAHTKSANVQTERDKLTGPFVTVDISHAAPPESDAATQKRSKEFQRITIAKAFAEAHEGVLRIGEGDGQRGTVRLCLPRAALD